MRPRARGSGCAALIPRGKAESGGPSLGADRAAAARGPPSRAPLTPPTPVPSLPQRYFGAAIGKGARAAKTEIEKLKFSTRTVAEALPLVAKIIVGVHDEAKDKPLEVELGWISESTGWKFEAVPAESRDAAVAATRALSPGARRAVERMVNLTN